MMVSELHTVTWDGINEWFDRNNYANPKIGYHGYLREGYQDMDYIEIKEDAEHPGEFHILVDGEDVI